MSRHLPILTLLAVPSLLLAACGSPPELAKAKAGECYSFEGRTSTGIPKLAKTACAGSPAAIAAACPAPAAPVQGPAACPGVGVSTGSGAKAHGAKERSVQRSARKTVHVARRARSAGSSYVWRDDRVAKSGEVTSLGLDYARVDQGLAGGPSDYHGQAYERREHYARVDQGPPPPPARFVERSHRGGSVEYSERSRQSSSYSASSSSSRGGYGAGPCDCDDRGAAPHSPFDGYGYLTWRGKTPG